MLFLVGLLLLLVIAVVATGLVEAKFVLAPLLGLAIWFWARATLRSFTAGAYGADLGDDGPEPVDPTSDDRTLYWCEECGTELLLVVKGSGLPPRHCGTRMHERTEILS